LQLLRFKSCRLQQQISTMAGNPENPIGVPQLELEATIGFEGK